MIQEWFDNQIPTYETIKAPMVGRDQEAEAWLKGQYEAFEKKPSWEEFLKEHQGYYVIPLAWNRMLLENRIQLYIWN